MGRIGDKMIKKNVKLEEEEKIKEILEKSKIEFKSINGEQHTFLNDEDVSKEIRSNEVNSMVSQVSALKFVRYKMVDLQRKLAEGKDVIMEGRDIGTYVFPNADVKIYLDAEPEERARRRQKQNEEAGIQSTYEEVLAGIIARDENDKNKEMGALKVAKDAIVVDGTHGTIEENVQKVIDIINKKKQKKKDGPVRKEKNNMLVQGIHHVCIRCEKSEIEEVKEFYQGVLGMPVIRSWGEPELAGFMFDTGAGLVEVFTDAEGQLPQGSIRHFALKTDDVDGCVKAVREAGYPITVEPKDIVIPSQPEFPVRVAFCNGPTGEEIEFFQEK